MDRLVLRHILAKNVRLAARRSGWTLVQLADFAGVSKSQLYDVAGSRRAATIDFLAKVSAATGMAPWEMLKPSKGTHVRRR